MFYIKDPISQDIIAQFLSLETLKQNLGGRLGKTKRSLIKLKPPPLSEKFKLLKWGFYPTLPKGFPMTPLRWDWQNIENKNWLSPVRDQVIGGPCVAFAAAAAVESHMKIERGNPNIQKDLSEASMFFTSNRSIDRTSSKYGWFIHEALQFLQEEGICFEESYPYVPAEQRAQLKKGSQRTYKISGFQETDDPNQMKRWLIEEGPLLASFRFDSSFPRFWYSGGRGIYRQTDRYGFAGHAVLVVGYDDLEGCWICKNSQSTDKGYEGYFKIGYGVAGIDNRMYLIHDVYSVDPRLEYRYDPLALQIVYKGSQGWMLTDGKKQLKMLDNYDDARDAFRVARRHNRCGFIGADNQRENRRDYIIEYWKGRSGLPGESLTHSDEVYYDPHQAVALDRDEKGWEIKFGENENLTLFANDLDDALAALNLVQEHRKIGIIGRFNKRPNPGDYMMTYWE
jgi:hypothetical protein